MRAAGADCDEMSEKRQAPLLLNMAFFVAQFDNNESLPTIDCSILYCLYPCQTHLLDEVLLLSTFSLMNNDAPLPLRITSCDAPPSKLTWPSTRPMHPAHQCPATLAPLCNAMSNHELVMHCS